MYAYCTVIASVLKRVRVRTCRRARAPSLTYYNYNKICRSVRNINACVLQCSTTSTSSTINENSTSYSTVVYANASRVQYVLCVCMRARAHVRMHMHAYYSYAYDHEHELRYLSRLQTVIVRIHQYLQIMPCMRIHVQKHTRNTLYISANVHELQCRSCIYIEIIDDQIHSMGAGIPADTSQPRFAVAATQMCIPSHRSDDLASFHLIAVMILHHE